MQLQNQLNPEARPPTSNKMRPIASALIFSVLFNGILIAIIASLQPRYPASIVVKVSEILAAPGTKFADWVIPTGHDALYFVGGFVVSILSSVLFYAALAWSALKSLARSRNRRPESVDLFTK